jgi:hypothetical protein
VTTASTFPSRRLWHLLGICLAVGFVSASSLHAADQVLFDFSPPFNFSKIKALDATVSAAEPGGWASPKRKQISLP